MITPLACKFNYRILKRRFGRRASEFKKSLLQSRFYSFITFIKPEFFVACVLASSLVIIDLKFDWLNATKLDFMQLMVATTSWYDTEQQPQGAEPIVTQEAQGKSYIVYLALINQQEYESTFNQSSPLDKLKFKAWLQNLEHQHFNENHPLNAVIIDLDISPIPTNTVPQKPVAEIDLSDFKCESEQNKELNQQQQLDQWLIEKAKCQQWQLFLISPMPVLTLALYKQKKTWMEKMSRAGIHFVAPLLPSNDGMVYQFYDYPNSLARTVYEQISAKPVCSSTQEKSMANFWGLLSYKGFKTTADNLLTTYAKDKCYQPKWLNYNLTQNINLINVPSVNTAKATKEVEIKEAGGDNTPTNVVFIGGNYGVTDFYETPKLDRNMLGVELHALSVISKLLPLKRPPLYGHYMIEILLATLLGVFLYKVNRYFNNADSWRMYVLILAVHMLLLFIYLFISGLLFKHTSLVTNPAILGAGIELRSLLLFRRNNSKTPIDAEQTPSQHSKFILYIKNIIPAVIVMSAVILIAMESA